MTEIGKYSMGLGDRFSHQGQAQLSALIKARSQYGIVITPVWNKSNREHIIVHSEPSDTRAEADAAVKALKYGGQYFVDADHINLTNVEKFIAHSDFFTLDVADYIGKKAADTDIAGFVENHRQYCGTLSIPGIDQAFTVTETWLRSFAEKYLLAINQASAIYTHIASVKGEGSFVTEVSMDEVDEPQKPLDMLFILKGLSDLKVPVQTVAPKFTGRFNKGVDYDGDPIRFGKEFEEDILVIDYAIRKFSLPANMKLSFHSGSDKFSIYPVMYATVIDINPGLLPSPDTVDGWDGERFAETLRHIPGNRNYNPGFRQLIHVGYKVASELGSEYTDALKSNREIIGAGVTENIFDRHIARIFG